MDCTKVQARLETFLDGELQPESTLEVEAHLDCCPRCAESIKFSQALRNSLCHVVKRECIVSDEFKRRLRTALAAERCRSPVTERAAEAEPVQTQSPRGDLARRRAEVEQRQHEGFPWRPLWTLVAAAAGWVLFLKWVPAEERMVMPPLGHSKTAVPDNSTHTAGFAGARTNVVDDALDKLIDYHSSPPAPQVVEEELVRDFEADVGVRVHAPSLQQFGALWEGASLVPVTDHAAAYLRYRMPRRHVTLYVYDPRKVPLRRSHAWRAVHTGDEVAKSSSEEGHANTVYLGHWRGYSVAAKEAEGIGYALAADLDDDAVSRLITEIH